MRITGVSASPARKSAARASVPFSVSPALSPRSAARWIGGPSAMGSEKGKPSSIRSAPAAGRPRRICRASSREGSPAIT